MSAEKMKSEPKNGNSDSRKGLKKNVGSYSISRRLTVSLFITVAFVSFSTAILFYHRAINKTQVTFHQKTDEIFDFLIGVLEFPLWDVNFPNVKMIGETISHNDLIVSLSIRSAPDILVYSKMKKGLTPSVYRNGEVFYQDECIGSVKIGFTDHYALKSRKELLSTIAATTSVILISLVFVTGIFIRLFLRVPLFRLNEIIASCASGEYNALSSPIPYIEFQPFGSILSKMGETIQQQIKQLHMSEEKYRSIFENSVEGIFQSSREGRIISANPSIAGILGYGSVDELMEMVTDTGKQIYRYPSTRSEVLRRFEIKDVLSGFEMQVRQKGGGFLWVRMNARAIRNRLGELEFIEGFLSDISWHKEAEARLKESEKAYRTLFETMKQGVVYQDESGEIFSANPAAERILGIRVGNMQEKEFQGIDWKPLNADGSDFSCDMHPSRVALRTGKAVYNVVMGIWNSEINRYSWIQVDAVPQFSDHLEGRSQVYIIFEDITEKKIFEDKRADLERQMRQTQKMEAIGVLAGGIAHDFNNILFPIMGFAEMVKETMPEDSKWYNPVNEILKGSMRARDLVKQILTFSRTADKEIKPIRIQLIAKEVVKLIRSTIPATISIRQNIDNKCGMVFADPTQIHQVIMNLVTNAYHAMEDSGGVLSIGLREASSAEDPALGEIQQGRFVCLMVADTGPGIDALHMDKIFEPYFTTKEKNKGTGLGLAVVHGIIKSYQGEIIVSSAPGEGVVFHVYLPRILSEAVIDDPEKSNIICYGMERILLVDDEEQILHVEKMMLEQMGYKTEEQTSGTEALAVFADRPDAFDLVITDMTMPEITGDKLALEMMAIRPDIPVIICTGFSEQLSEEIIGEIGVKGLLMKPILKAELTEMIRKILDEKC